MRTVFGFLLIFFIVSQDSSAQFVAPGYTIKNWTIEDGLPVNTINSIIQAENGYLWMATSGGLVRFDGIDFKVYTSADYPGLEGNRILELRESNDGSILIINQGSDIFALKNERFKKLNAPNQGIVGEGRSGAFYKDSEGGIWFGDETGIKIYKDGVVATFFEEQIIRPIQRIYKVDGNTVWYMYFSDPYLYRFKDGVEEKIVKVNINDRKSEISDNAFLPKDGVFIIDYQNEKLIFTGLDIFKYEDNNLSRIYESDTLLFTNVVMDSKKNIIISSLSINSESSRPHFLGYQNGTVQSLQTPFKSPIHKAILHNSDLWTDTDTDYKIFKGKELVFQSENLVQDFIIDKEESIWIASTTNGLIQLKPNFFTSYTTEEGLAGNNSTTVFQDADSSIWVGSFGEGISNLSDSIINVDFELNGGKNKAYILSIEQLNDGKVLIGGLFQGLLSFDIASRNFTPFPAHEEVNRFSVHSIFEDSKNRLWIGTSPKGERGLFVKRNNRWEALAGRENVPFALYQTIYEVPNGNIWFSARGEGLVRFDGESFHHYSTENGFSSNFIRGINFFVEPETKEGWLIVGSEGNGIDIVRLENGAPDFSSLKSLDKTNGLYDNSIHVILEDDQDRFWLNTNQGIFWIEKAEIIAFLKGETNEVISTSYTEEDGLVHREGNGGSQPSGIKAFDGTLWFPGQGGIVAVDPTEITLNPHIPPIHIQHVLIEETVAELEGGELILEPDQRNFEINFAALSYRLPEKNSYRYRLEGFQDHKRKGEWFDLKKRRTVYFTNVPSGEYTFVVQGSNNDGLWNQQGASLKIIIKPYFYENIWFFIVMAGAIFGFIFLGVGIRERRLKNRQVELERIISERTLDLKKGKEAAEHQKELIDELSKAKDTFFTNISHELRTPLTLVLGPIQSMFQDRAEASDKWKRNLILARRNGFRLKQLIEQVLDLTRLDSSKVELNPIKLDVGLKVKLITESFESVAISRGITLNVSIPEEEICAGVDSDKFQKILVNLISNAIKFTPKKGVINVSVNLKGDFVEFSVSDTGVGIEKDRIPYIFDRFHTEEKGAAIESRGLGVGLNLTKEFIELHGGTITVDSEYEKGSTFLVTLRSCPKTMAKEGLPVLDDDQEINIYNSSLPAISPEKKGEIRTTSILLVEDNDDMREYISGILLEEGIKISEARNGIEGKKQLTLAKPDLIISDVMMPDMDGFEFSKFVRSVPEYRLTPIVMLTALTDLENRLQAFDIGVSDYLIKPFIEKELKARIHNLLRLKVERDKMLTGEKEKGSAVSEGSAFTKRLQSFVNENITNPQISVEELGSVVNMSRRQFYRKLKIETGFTPAEFVKEIRLFKARQIIENKSAQNISEVAYSVGFSTPSYFTKVYEERFGSRPGAHLKA